MSTSKPIMNLIEKSVDITTSNSDGEIVIDEFDVTYCSDIRVYTKTTTSVTGAPDITLQVSPLSTGDVWADTGITLTAHATAPNVLVYTANSGQYALEGIRARRARLELTNKPDTGAFTAYVIGW